MKKKIALKPARRRMSGRKAAKLTSSEDLAARRLKAPTWRLPAREMRPLPPVPDLCGQDYNGLAPTAEPDEPEPKQPKRPSAAPLRRAVRAKPTRGTHGPNRGGESARSWQPAGERNPSRLPIDVGGFLDEEF